MASLADLSDLQNSWSSNCSDKHFPKFCPQSTGPYHTLILLETPGSEARDGKVSMFNKDDTAREICRLVNIAFNEDKRSGVLLWNAIPWVLDDKRQPKISDVIEAIELGLHDELLKLLSNDLKFVVLMGGHSRRLLPYLSTKIGNAHLLGGHHTSRRTKNFHPESIQENEAVFQHIRNSFKSHNF